MYQTLVFIQTLNLLLSLTCICYGVVSYKSINNLKPLILLPVYSIIQIIFSEIGIKLFNGNYSFGNLQYTSVAVYIIIEFVIILYFYFNIFTSVFLRSFLKFVALTSIFLLLIDVNKAKNSSNLNLFLFQMFSGFSIELLSYLGFREIIKKENIENILTQPNSIMILGILFSFIIIAPFSVLQNFLLSRNQILYEFLFLTNSLGYFILFSFLIFAIYVSRKSRDF
jgi:hypothetical protein